MAGQILRFDYAGRHNSSLANASYRIVRGATFKRQRIVMLIPAIGAISPKVYMSHQVLVFPRNQPVSRMLCMGEEVGIAYSDAIVQILEDPVLGQFEYVLTIEHDNTPPPDGVLKLIRRMEQHPEFAAISGLYWEKGEDGQPQCWGDISDPEINFRPQPPPEPGKIGEYCGVAMGFGLWRLAMFRDPRFVRPYFETIHSANQYDADVATQDLAFWRQARRLGYRCAVDADVLVGHYDPENDVVW